MRASEIRDWDDVEIRARLKELREERFRLRFRMGTMQLENPRLVSHIRRDVARLNTILRERELADASDGSGTSGTGTSDVPETAETVE